MDGRTEREEGGWEGGREREGWVGGWVGGWEGGREGEGRVGGWVVVGWVGGRAGEREREGGRGIRPRFARRAWPRKDGGLVMRGA